MTSALIASRFVHVLALSVLFGGALFPLYGFAPAHENLPLRVSWLGPLLLAAALLTLISAIAWFGLAIGGASGNVSGTFQDLKFGWAWLIRLPLAIGLVALQLGKRDSPLRYRAVLAGSLILLASVALTGHAGSDQSPAALQHRILDAVHLLASGVWVGALVVLARLVMTPTRQLRDDDLRTLHNALSRFSGVGTVAVAALTLSGILNPGFSSSLSTVYGRVLLLKLALFGAMLMLAAANRFWLTPRLSDTLESVRGSRTALFALKASILTETMLAVLVLLIVGWLGTLSPPGFR